MASIPDLLRVVARKARRAVDRAKYPAAAALALAASFVGGFKIGESVSTPQIPVAHERTVREVQNFFRIDDDLPFEQRRQIPNADAAGVGDCVSLIDARLPSDLRGAYRTHSIQRIGRGVPPEFLIVLVSQNPREFRANLRLTVRGNGEVELRALSYSNASTQSNGVVNYVAGGIADRSFRDEQLLAAVERCLSTLPYVRRLGS